MDDDYSKLETGYVPVFDRVRRLISGTHLTLADTKEYLQGQVKTGGG